MYLGSYYLVLFVHFLCLFVVWLVGWLVSKMKKPQRDGNTAVTLSKLGQ